MLVDTNVLVRHLTGSPLSQARRATRFLASVAHVTLPSIIVAELVHVLESVYDVPPGQIATLVRSVLAHPPTHAPEHDVLLRAVELYEGHRIDFEDAYLAATAEQDDGKVASFDRDFDRIATVDRIEP